jgi:hypothetical protein
MNKIYPKECQNELCKKPFIGYSHQKYCSYECLRKSYSNKYCPSEVREINCLWCHSTVKATSKTHLFCGTSCRVEFYRLKHMISEKYFFEHDKKAEEFERLKVLGCSYVLEAIC